MMKKTFLKQHLEKIRKLQVMAKIPQKKIAFFFLILSVFVMIGALFKATVRLQLRVLGWQVRQAQDLYKDKQQELAKLIHQRESAKQKMMGVQSTMSYPPFVHEEKVKKSP